MRGHTGSEDVARPDADLPAVQGDGSWVRLDDEDLWVVTRRGGRWSRWRVHRSVWDDVSARGGGVVVGEPDGPLPPGWASLHDLDVPTSVSGDTDPLTATSSLPATVPTTPTPRTSRSLPERPARTRARVGLLFATAGILVVATALGGSVARTATGATAAAPVPPAPASVARAVPDDAPLAVVAAVEGAPGDARRGAVAVVTELPASPDVPASPRVPEEAPEDPSAPSSGTSPGAEAGSARSTAKLARRAPQLPLAVSLAGSVRAALTHASISCGAVEGCATWTLADPLAEATVARDALAEARALSVSLTAQGVRRRCDLPVPPEVARANGLVLVIDEGESGCDGIWLRTR